MSDFTQEWFDVAKNGTNGENGEFSVFKNMEIWPHLHEDGVVSTIKIVRCLDIQRSVLNPRLESLISSIRNLFQSRVTRVWPMNGLTSYNSIYQIRVSRWKATNLFDLLTLYRKDATFNATFTTAILFEVKLARGVYAYTLYKYASYQEADASKRAALKDKREAMHHRIVNDDGLCTS